MAGLREEFEDGGGWGLGQARNMAGEPPSGPELLALALEAEPPKPGTRLLQAAAMALGLALALASGGCSKPAPVLEPEPAPAVVVPADKSAAQVRMAEAFGTKLSLMMAGGISSWASAWEGLQAAEQASPPDRRQSFAMDRTWGEFLDGAKGKKDLELLGWVCAHWDAVQLNKPFSDGDTAYGWEPRSKILKAGGMLFSHSMRTGQASLAAAKAATLKELGWPGAVWVTGFSSPATGGFMFAACAEDRNGKIWLMPSKPGVQPMEATPAAVGQIWPDGKAEAVFSEKGMRVLAWPASGQIRLLPGTLGAERMALHRDLRRLAGIRPAPSSQTPSLVLEPGKEVSVKPS